MASLEEVKEIIKSSPISQIVGYYHPISKKGANYEGICPFHGDSHPSLKINDDKGIYKCFACGAAGDAIGFVQDKLNVDFVSALKDIAQRMGITIEDNSQKNKNPKYDMALRVLKAANRLYKKIANEKKPALYSQFLSNRNLNDQSVTDFEIGYAQNGNVLLNYLNSIPEQKEKEFALNVAQQIGLIRPSKNGKGHYDFYRDRVVFPIWDHTGKVRGFSSRAVKEDQKPKYLNSGESFIFDKGNTLYGFNIAKNNIRSDDSVIICEGNMDVIVLHQYGFRNSVGTMGVALSQNSVKLLSSMTKKIYLAMDSDNAGIKAMERINSDFLDQDILPLFVDFSPAKDPDEFLNQFGRLELLKRLEEAPSFVDYMIQKTLPENLPERTDKKLEILQEVFKIVQPIKSSLMANEKVVYCAKSLGLRSTDEDIINEFKVFKEKNPKKQFQVKKKPVQKNLQNQAQNAPLQQRAQNTEHEPPPNFQEEIDYSQLESLQYSNSEENFNFHDISDSIVENKITASKEEKILLENLLTHPQCVMNNQITEILDLIEHFEVKRIVQWLKTIYLEIDETEYTLFIKQKMNEDFSDDIKKVMASSIFNYKNMKLESKVVDKMMLDLKKKIKISNLKKQRDLLKIEQKNSITDEESLILLGKIQDLERELLELRKQ